MKRVLLIETLSQVNGGQKMSLLISQMLRDSGQYEVVWAIPQEGSLSERLKAEHSHYFLLGDLSLPAGIKRKTVVFRYGWMSLCAIAQLNRRIRREKIDIIYAPGPAALPWSAICGSLTRRPVIWHLHHMFEDGATFKLINYFSRRKSVKRIICISKCVAGQIKTQNLKCTVVYNPVDYDKYANGEKSRVIGELEKAMPGCSSMTKIVQIGTLEPEKRQIFTVCVLSELKRRGFPACVILAGQEPSSSSGYQKRIEICAQDERVDKLVYFAGKRDDIADILRCCDIAIVPSIEGLSLVALEAAAAGTPVAGVDIAGVRELLELGRFGEIFKFDDVNVAADTIERIVSKIPNGEYVKNGKCFAKKLTMKRYSDSLLAIFKEN